MSIAITTGLNYTLDFSNYKSFYANREHSPTGIPPNFHASLDAGGCMISRLIHGLIFVNKVDKSEKRVIYSTSSGKRLVAWKQESEETCVNFRRLIGFSSGIKFKLIVSITPGALACSDVLTGCAVGTGLLLFESTGHAIDSNCDTGSFPHERMIAWSRSSVFEFDSSVKIFDCYLSSTYLRPTNGAIFVIDPDTERKGKPSTFMKLLKKIYLP